MWVRFLRRYRFIPPEDRRIGWRYEAGAVRNVRRVCGRKAIKAGAAVEVPTPSREEASRWRADSYARG